MAISNSEFRETLGRFASGVTVVTTRDGKGQNHGLTVSAFCSVSMDPPLVLVCIQKSTGSHHAFEESGVFVVNLLAEDQQQLSNHFASRSDDKFAGVEFDSGIESVPVLRNCLAALECRLRNAFDGGDHSIFVGEVEKSSCADMLPLTYYRGKYRRISDFPEN
jgi:flavin reductase (DIM6/NTAB) family NADH-FMN oxidoreductase RutF